MRNGTKRSVEPFDKCEDLMFPMFGVHREKLTDLWPEEPFLRSSGSDDPFADARSVVTPRVSVSEKVVELGDASPSPIVTHSELETVKLQVAREKLKYYRLQNELLTLELGQRKALARRTLDAGVSPDFTAVAATDPPEGEPSEISEILALQRAAPEPDVRSSILSRVDYGSKIPRR